MAWFSSLSSQFSSLVEYKEEFDEKISEKFIAWGDFVIAFNYGLIFGIGLSLGTIFYLLSMQDKKIYDRPLAKLSIDTEIDRLRKKRRMKEAQQKVKAGEMPKPIVKKDDDFKDDNHVTRLTLSKLSWNTIISDLSSGKLSITGWEWTKKNIFFRDIEHAQPLQSRRRKDKRNGKLL